MSVNKNNKKRVAEVVWPWRQEVDVVPVHMGGKWVLVSVFGTVMAWLVFAPLFYACFTLARIVRAIKGVDTLGRKFPSEKKTYWVEWKTPEDLDSYKHQF